MLWLFNAFLIVATPQPQRRLSKLRHFNDRELRLFRVFLNSWR